MNWKLLLNSFLVSALTTLLSLVFGLMAALWLSGLTPGLAHALARRGHHGVVAAAVFGDELLAALSRSRPGHGITGCR